ncbi:MAG TPA: hypothetical protein VMZ04_02590, partial [Anaerolineae bacterium]|nr:hypothetical protein [Anaerolineae bacterium]
MKDKIFSYPVIKNRRHFLRQISAGTTSLTFGSLGITGCSTKLHSYSPSRKPYLRASGDSYV